MRAPVRLVLALLILGASSVAVRAQTECPTTAGSAIVSNPREVYARLPEFERKLLDGTTVAIPAYEVGFFVLPNSPTSPVQSAGMIAKAAWTAVDTATNCYKAALPGLQAVPVGQKFYARLRAVGDAAIGTSDWSDVSGPFGSEPRPVPPGLPTLRP